MGTGLEMTGMKNPLRLLICALTLLADCGNAPDARDAKNSSQAFAQLAKLFAGKLNPGNAALDPAAVAALRTALEKDGQPVYSVAIAAFPYANLMAPYGQNGDVQTWASTSYETISLRDSILVATRGFGPDLMSAVAPSLAQVRKGSGSFHRIYYYLDGADQTQSYGLDCQFAPSGSEDVSVLGKSYPTHVVTESCSGSGYNVKNIYWFDGSGKLRQSDQVMTLGVSPMRLQRVID